MIAVSELRYIRIFDVISEFRRYIRNFGITSKFEYNVENGFRYARQRPLMILSALSAAPTCAVPGLFP